MLRLRLILGLVLVAAEAEGLGGVHVGGGRFAAPRLLLELVEQGVGGRVELAEGRPRLLA